MVELIKDKKGMFDILVTAISVTFSVGTMLYAVSHFGLKEAWPELVLNLIYIACLVMIWMYFFKFRITSMQFNYWCTLCIGLAVLLRDILFAPPLRFFSIHLLCLTFSVLLLVMLTYFYARRQWSTYSKRNLWTICIVDMVIASLYTYAIIIEPINDYTNFLLTEIWIRPTITYGLVVCFVTENDSDSQ